MRIRQKITLWVKLMPTALKIILVQRLKRGMSRVEKHVLRALLSRALQSLCFERSSRPGELSHFPLTQHSTTTTIRSPRTWNTWYLIANKRELKILHPCVMLCLLNVTLPASLAHLRMEVTSLPSVVLHWDRTAAALTPTVPSLALTPQR